MMSIVVGCVDVKRRKNNNKRYKTLKTRANESEKLP